MRAVLKYKTITEDDILGKESWNRTDALMRQRAYDYCMKMPKDNSYCPASHRIGF